MEPENSKIAELEQLLWQLRDGAIAAEGRSRIETLVTGDAEVRRYYIRYSTLCGGLRWLNADDQGRGARDEGRGMGDEGRGMAGSPAIERPAAKDLVFGDLEIWRFGDSPLAGSHPPLSALHSPLSATFVGGPVFSYMVATVILGVMLLSAWAYKITHYQQQYVQAPPSSVSSSDRPELVFVGRVSGMIDCKWADPQTETYVGASVSVNRKYALASGLMEIAYNTGAKVILEGPCSYEVESRAGGYLSLGKLTAKVVSGQWPVASAKPQAANPKSPNLQISKSPNHYPLSTIHYPLFSVRTPTAIITDLGTEFGVEVSEEGTTTSHVFRGSVKVQVVGDEGQKDVVLRANESARVERGAGSDVPRLVPAEKIGQRPKFVRRLVEPLKTLDLLDVVAGGNGRGDRRGSGIDPATGRRDTFITNSRRVGDGQYWPVVWSRLIDGTFVPNGWLGAVQVDSAGDTFDGFPETVGRTWGPLWARTADDEPNGPDDAPTNWIHMLDHAERFTPARRGLLCMHANAGITFHLETMRAMNLGVRPERFQAVAGIAETHNLPLDADGQAVLWVIVDGRLKMKYSGLCRKDGPVTIDVPLGPRDRFLTLATTDGGDGITSDWVVLGDPVLIMSPTQQEENK